MRILYWTPLFWPETAGIEVVAQNMVTGLRDRGHQLLVMASHGSTLQPDDTTYEGVPIRRFHFWQALSRRDLGLIAAIRREVAALIKGFQPDVIHCNFSGYTAYFQLANAKACQAPLLIALHSSLFGRGTGADTVLGNLLRAADWVTAVSQSTLDDARAIAGEIGGRSSVIYNGLTLRASDPAPLPWAEPRLMAIGRLAFEKGFDLAIAALKLLRERFPRLTLHLVGDGPERAALQRQASDLGIEKSVEFVGMVPNRMIPDLLKRATIVLIPSRSRESFSLVAVEAAQMGRPVVAAAAGGLREVVREGETGLLVELESPQAIATAVGTLLVDPQRTGKMGNDAREWARNAFGLDRMIGEYETVYRRLAVAKPQVGSNEVRP
ncbi:MAG: glycosyltransferase family 4 protein [Candidatus Aminicenantes bacterium]|nr:glycosyltransferase family 4 protein [Candidatus Aminicenantes bacterium]